MSLVVQQESAIKKDLTNNLKAQGFNDGMVDEYFDKWKEDVQQKAVFQVRSGLIMEALAKKYNVETSDSDFDARLDEIAAEAGISAEEVKKYYTSDANIKNNLLYGIREEKTFAALTADLKITEK
jgi:trigger factor